MHTITFRLFAIFAAAFIAGCAANRQIVLNIHTLSIEGPGTRPAEIEWPSYTLQRLAATTGDQIPRGLEQMVRDSFANAVGRSGHFQLARRGPADATLRVRIERCGYDDPEHGIVPFIEVQTELVKEGRVLFSCGHQGTAPVASRHTWEELRRPEVAGAAWQSAADQAAAETMFDLLDAYRLNAPASASTRRAR